MTERVYYSIKQVSEITGLSYAVLRSWEKLFVELCPKTNAGKTRFYTPQDLELIKRIQYLRYEQGLSVKVIQRRLDTEPKKVDREKTQTEILTKIREELVALRDLI